MSTSRPFAFGRDTSNKARIRQQGLCAHCGRSLDHQMEFAHHVIPNQCGNPSDPSHAWLREAVNCVVLCDECHQRVHQDGRTRDGAVAPSSYFRHSHKSRREHGAWALEVKLRALPVWNHVREKATVAAQQAGD